MRGESPPSGTLAGAAHRGWIDLQAALSSGAPHAILTECERAENIGLVAYREALGNPDLDDDARRLVQRHYEAVQAAHDRVRQLRERIMA
jgi:uncharacterized protein (TIGR02284 family)